MQNYKKILLLVLLVGPYKTFGMLQRCAPKIAPVTTAALLASKRFLCGNQANDPMWIKANDAVEEFHKKHGFKELDATQLNHMASVKNKAVLKNLKESEKNPDYLRLIFDNPYNLEADVVRPIVEPLLKKHGLDVKKVVIAIDQYAIFVSPTGPGVAGDCLLFGYNFMEQPFAHQVAMIEYVLAHMICRDSEYALFYKDILSADLDAKHEYALLINRRAATHSALQSLENTKILIQMTNDLPELDLVAKEQKLKKLHHQSTYLENLLAYMSKKEQEK